MTVVDLLDDCDQAVALVSSAFDDMDVRTRRDYFEGRPGLVEAACTVLMRNGLVPTGLVSFKTEQGETFNLAEALKLVGYAQTSREFLEADPGV